MFNKHKKKTHYIYVLTEKGHRPSISAKAFLMRALVNQKRATDKDAFVYESGQHLLDTETFMDKLTETKKPWYIAHKRSDEAVIIFTDEDKSEIEKAVSQGTGSTWERIDNLVEKKKP